MRRKSHWPGSNGSAAWLGAALCLMMISLVSCTGLRPARIDPPSCPRFGPAAAAQMIMVRESGEAEEMSEWIEDIVIYCFVEEI